jgi:large subunit ribosomal protein L13
MKTTSIKPADIKKKWVIVDAADQTLGRLASEIAYVLRGKNQTNFTPHVDTGDHVVVVNAEKIRLTGNKLQAKSYYWHSGYIGGIKRATAADLLAKKPERILEIAVKGMLPKNKLGRKMFNKLNVYTGTEHPHQAQQPEPMKPRTAAGEGK